jgi:hypothetical protein
VACLVTHAHKHKNIDIAVIVPSTAVKKKNTCLAIAEIELTAVNNKYDSLNLHHVGYLIK